MNRLSLCCVEQNGWNTPLQRVSSCHSPWTWRYFKGRHFPRLSFCGPSFQKPAKNSRRSVPFCTELHESTFLYNNAIQASQIYSKLREFTSSIANLLHGLAKPTLTRHTGSNMSTQICPAVWAKSTKIRITVSRKFAAQFKAGLSFSLFRPQW